MLITLVNELNERRPKLHKYHRYYLGKQKVKFMGADLQHEFGQQLQSLNSNRCKTVVDAVVNKLSIEGFEDRADESNHEGLAEAFWEDRNMDAIARQVHQEALIHGDAYVLVWPNEEIEVFSQQSDSIAVLYDDENPDKLYAAAKAWKLRDGRWRVNVYYEDRLEKFISKRPADYLPDSIGAWDEYSDPQDPSWPITYDFGRVPVFHFAVNARSGEYGVSDLEVVIPMQDSLNRTLANQAVAEEFQSYKQRWATGIQPLEVENEETGEREFVSPFDSGADRLWTTTNDNAKFGEFSSADLRMFEDVANGHEMRIARASSIPIYYIMQSGTPPSGESWKTAEVPFIDKVLDRQRSFGTTWNQFINFVLLLQHGIVARVEVVWKSPETRDARVQMDLLIEKVALGVSKKQALRELGYSDEQIAQFAEENLEDFDGTYPS